MKKTRKTDELGDYPILGHEEAGEESLITQVEPGLSRIDTIPEDNQSLLSPQVLKELTIESIAGEETLPSVFLARAAPHLHSTSGIVDLATTVCLAVSRGEIKAGQSAELRKWAELMYTCVVANAPKQNNVQVNYVEQLIQLAGGEEAVQPEVLDVRDAILSTPTKKAQGE